METRNHPNYRRVLIEAGLLDPRGSPLPPPPAPPPASRSNDSIDRLRRCVEVGAVAALLLFGLLLTWSLVMLAGAAP